MWNFINRNYWNVVIVAVIVLALICGASLIFGGDSGEPSFAADVLNTAITPVKTGISKVTGAVGGFFRDIAAAKNAAAENEKLKDRIKELENENVRLDEFKNENDELRKLLDFKSKQTAFTTVACEVVGRSFSNWSTEFVVNKGTDNGIDVGAVVIENGGLVGSVTMAGKNWARVTTVLDSGSSVSATVIRSGASGIVEGDLTLSGDKECMLNYTMKDADIAIGDTLETSGLGKMYPQGIIIGKVKTVEQISGQINKKITVEISADIYNLGQVLVITAY